MKRSRNKLVNQIFKLIIDVIIMKSSIADRYPIRVKFCKLDKKSLKKRNIYMDDSVGLTFEPGDKNGLKDAWLILIEHRISKSLKGRVFLHEMLHILFWNENRENPILKLEEIIWPELSEDQKKFLIQIMYLLSKF